MEMELERPDGARLRLRCPIHLVCDGVSAGLFGGGAMIQLTPQSRIFLATEPVDFRKGIGSPRVPTAPGRQPA